MPPPKYQPLVVLAGRARPRGEYLKAKSWTHDNRGIYPDYEAIKAASTARQQGLRLLRYGMDDLTPAEEKAKKGKGTSRKLPAAAANAAAVGAASTSTLLARPAPVGRGAEHEP